MASAALVWTAVLLAAAGVGASFLLTDGFGLRGGSTVILLSDDGCRQASVEVPADLPAHAERHELAVRAGEAFHLPAPAGNGTAVRYELHAGDVGVGHAHADGAPVQRHGGAFGDALGGCAPLTPGMEATGVGPFVAQRDGTVTAYAWRVEAAPERLADPEGGETY